MVEAIYLCPAGPSETCTWEGKAEEITQHFQTEHEDLVITTNSFPIGVSSSSKQNKLFCLKDEVYLIQAAVLSEKLLLKVRYLGSAEQALAFTYTVSIRAGSYAFKFLPDESCQTIYIKDGGVEVDLQMIKLACGVPSLEYVVCVLDITPSPEKTNTASDTSDEDLAPHPEANNVALVRRRNFKALGSSERSSTRNINYRNSFLQSFFYDDATSVAPASLDSTSVYSLYLEERLFSNPELECATCCSEMCPPIFICTSGHSVCGACKNEKCRRCNQDILDIRNTDLEDISMKKKHSCKYAPHGCGEMGNYNEIRRHEVNCRFCVYKCSLCPQEGKFSEIRSHFKLLHSSVKVYDSLKNKFPKNSSFAIVSSEHGIFYCASSQANGCIEWNVTFCGPKERWFSCDLRIKGKKEELTYSFRRNVNTYTLTLSQADLKAAGVKDKHAVLEISS